MNIKFVLFVFVFLIFIGTALATTIITEDGIETTGTINSIIGTNVTGNSIFHNNVTILGTLIGGSPVKVHGGLNILTGNITLGSGYLIGNGSLLTDIPYVFGLNGSNGLNGTNGLNGLNGTNGSVGINGLNGTNGNQGLQGIQGIAGLNGTNGTDSINNTNWNNNYSVFLTHTTQTYVNLQNSSLVNWANSVFASLTTIVNAVGNWSADKVNYPTLNILNNGSYLNYAWNATNTSYMEIKNWNATNTSYLTAEIDSKAYNGTLTLQSVLMNGSFFNTASSDTFVANYSTFLTHTTASYVDTQNTSQTNYINSNNNSITNTFNLYTLISTLVDRLGNWSADKINYYTKTDINNFNASYLNMTNSSYMTGDNFTLQNTSMANYVLYVNSTNGAGGGSSTLVSNVTCLGTDKVSAYNNITGTFVCSTDQTGAGGGGLTEWINWTTTSINQSGSAVDKIIPTLNATLLANSVYLVDCDIWYYTVIVTTGITINVSFSQPVLRNSLGANFPASATTITYLNGTNTLGYAGFNATGSAGVNVRGNLDIEGFIKTSGVATTLTYKFKSELASPQWVVVDDYSSCRYTKLS